MLWVIAFVAATLTWLSARYVRIMMQRMQIVDQPKRLPRKTHKRPIPLGGGLALYVGISLPMLALWKLGLLSGGSLQEKTIIGLLWEEVL